ncbi:hypothetical protein BLNAU_21041 [Blattamonas nauphoetae]|uniref:Uncharacterized protein n=1 Tax=Blattamonas nauphoetae TaxID=2049346 RepID=A0ABQ9WWZ9_9EUKA|nr:hypothetical protein BLNAU_21041 [Blattamonas nauphoetae]
MDCSPFLDWDKDRIDSKKELPIVFLSLVATVKLRPSFDDPLEAKAVAFLKSVETIGDEPSALAFLSSFARKTDESLSNFLQCIVVLISSASITITEAAIEMINSLFTRFFAKVNLALVKADVIPRLIIALNPQSLPFADAVKIHLSLLEIIATSLWLSTLHGIAYLTIEDDDEQQAVHETVLTKVVAPAEMYIFHLCVNRYSIVDELLSITFIFLPTHV